MQLPRYTYMVTNTGLKYGWIVGKAFINHTPPGRFIKGAVIIYGVGRGAYVYGTHKHSHITIRDKFWRYEDNEQD